MSDEQELQRLREEVQQLRQQLNEIGRKLERMSYRTPPPILPAMAPPPIASEPATAVPEPPVAADTETPPILEAPKAQVEAPPLIAAAPGESFEVRLGTYWLPRIGLAALLTGMVFFAAYITPRLSISQKVALSYLACAVLGGVGLWLEKRTPQLARILQAGSLALVYFVTFAAHFTKEFRVIESPTLAIAMLSVVVVFIVGAAQARQSATLGGMALFFGYYTSVASGVATFTLASNAVLALAALYFLARNRWVTISYGAVLATYLTYMIWVWKLNRWGELDRLVFESGYLSAQDFHLRAGFLALYWLLFTIGGLMVARDAMVVAERNGLVTLNNAFFFVLFSLLMHHTYPESQWQFQFSFAGALLMASAVAYQRYQPERSVRDTLLLQGLAVATLGFISYFKGVQLVAVLALESAFLLVLSRWMRSRWIAWIARAAFTVAAVYAWSRYDRWDNAMLWGITFASAVGYVCARMERKALDDKPAGPINFAALYYAVWATLLAMSVANEHFETHMLPWVWTLGAVAVALIAGVLRVREIGWAAHLPLAFAQATFYMAKLDDRSWNLAPALALVAVTLGFGLFLWGLARTKEDRVAATSALWPYAFLALAVALVATWDHCPERWQLAAFATETLALVFAGMLADEGVFIWLSLLPMAVGAAGYLFSNNEVFDAQGAAWTNLVVGLALFVFAERVLRKRGTFQELCVAIVVVVTGLALFGVWKLVSGALLTVGWALLGFVLLAIGFAIKHRPYRMAGLVVLAFSLARAVFHDMARVETIYRILSFIGLGVILLVLAFLYAKNREKLAKWL
jgi:uncharacterized membrane protein